MNWKINLAVKGVFIKANQGEEMNANPAFNGYVFLMKGVKKETRFRLMILATV
jgi:hypothetical protein